MLKQLFAWWTKKSPRDLLLETIADARCFEEWEAAGKQVLLYLQLY
jgi:TAG lipase/lysophosphatidylethanolamine acyltransferase